MKDRARTRHAPTPDKTLPDRIADELIGRIFVEQHKLFATAANKHGRNVKNAILPEAGVFGNTHYPIADTNKAQAFGVVSQWLKAEKMDK